VLDDQAEKTRNARKLAELDQLNMTVEAIRGWLAREEASGATVVRIESVRALLPAEGHH
jgi:hypothetical protein